MANPIPTEPSFSGQGLENPEDSALILGDQDITNLEDGVTDEEKLGADGSEANPLSLENEPPEFIRGERDVVDQMKRTTQAIDYKATSSLIRGARDDDFESATPEPSRMNQDIRDMAVEMDKAALQGEELHERAAEQLAEDIAEMREAADEADRDGDVLHRDADEFVTGQFKMPENRGRPTGAYTDIGAGKSGVTKKSLH